MKDKAHSLHEAIADIGIIAGQAGYYSGDSRLDVADIIEWAKEFEAKYADEDWGGEIAYIETIEVFAVQKFQQAEKARR